MTGSPPCSASIRFPKTVAKVAQEHLLWPHPWTLGDGELRRPGSDYDTDTRTVTMCYEQAFDFVQLYSAYVPTKPAATPWRIRANRGLGESSAPRVVTAGVATAGVPERLTSGRCACAVRGAEGSSCRDRLDALSDAMTLLVLDVAPRGSRRGDQRGTVPPNRRVRRRLRTTWEESLDHRESLQPLDPPREARRRFLKQIATTGVIAGAGALPVGRRRRTSPRHHRSRRRPLPRTRRPPARPSPRRSPAMPTSLRYEDLPPEVVRETKRYPDRLRSAAGSAASAPTPSQIANRLAAGVSARARRHRHVQRREDEPRSRRLRQRRDDPLSRFQRRLYQPSAAGHPSDTIAALLTTAET